jgi:2-phosphoglycolate phosphatase
MMNADNVRGVIFDLDGTLIDSYQAIYLSFYYTYSEMGLPPLSFKQVEKAVGRGLSHTFRELLGEERVPLALSLFRKRYEEVFRTHTHLLPDVRQVVESLQDQGIQLAVATNKLGRFSRAILEHFGIAERFAVILGDGDVSQNKPDPEMLYLALEKMGVGKEKAIFVGDSVIDIQTGKNAGIRVFAVPTGNTDREDLVKAQPTVILSRLLDLLSLV